MQQKTFFISTILCCFLLGQSCEAAPTSLFGLEENQTLFVNNRIVAKVNGKAISVLDIMKKMDLLFYRQYPEYASSLPARFQFYQANWKHILQELMDKELILADAHDAKLPISAGDVRQEMEAMFGPNIIHSLDQAGLSFEEAMKMVQEDITIRRMIYSRVNAKVMKSITPQDIKKAYETYSKENIRPDIWRYHVISIRDKDVSRGAEAANLVHNLLNEKVPLSELTLKIKQTHPFENTSINVSEEYRHTEKEMSAAYKEILEGISSQSHSKPIPQKSRTDQSTVFRVFYLDEMQKGGAPSLKEVENEIKNRLTEVSVGEETERYIKKLRQHFDVQESYLKEMISSDFQPFSLK